VAGIAPFELFRITKGEVGTAGAERSLCMTNVRVQLSAELFSITNEATILQLSTIHFPLSIINFPLYTVGLRQTNN
jgi:hypothetical protein